MTPQNRTDALITAAAVAFIIAAFYFVFIPLYNLGRAMGPCVPNSAGNCTGGITIGTMG